MGIQDHIEIRRALLSNDPYAMRAVVAKYERGKFPADMLITTRGMLADIWSRLDKFDAAKNKET